MISKITFRAWTAPIALLLLCLVSFGLLIPRLGFYWDDWPTIWYLHMLGPDSFQESFAIDRPFLAWLFMITTRIFGESIAGWQLFGIFTRWMSCMVLWWTLRLLWPQNTTQATWITFLFAIYPGFSQQYISVTYSHGFLLLALFLFSLGSMILAYRQPGRFWLWISLSLVSAALSMFISEYFFGLELLRPLFLWMVTQDQPIALRQRLKQIALRWSPYVLLMGLFLVWRTLLSTTERGEIQIFDRLFASPLATLLEMGRTIIQDLFEVSALAWAQTLDLREALKLSPEQTLIYLVLVIFAAALISFYLLRLRITPASSGQAASEKRSAWAKQAILLGLFALLVGGWPFWVTYLPIKLRFPWDRFTLAMMLGASILVVGLIDLLRAHRLKVVILGVLVGLAVGLHYQTGLAYSQLWETQKSLFWQLTWRAPAIEPSTLLITPKLPFRHYSDNSLTAPLNWSYAPAFDSRQMPYLIFDIEARLDNALTSFEPGIPIQHPYRAMYFEGTTSQALVFYYEPPRCLVIVDPGKDQGLPEHPLFIPAALALSNLQTIEANPISPARPPAKFFGPEPEPTWCYYFEKADLARQTGDWGQAAEYGEQAAPFLAQLAPQNAIEMLVFIQSFAHTGQWEKAVEWTEITFELDPTIKDTLCKTWLDFYESAPHSPEKDAAIQRVAAGLSCNSDGTQ